jgi:hypothetical protein
LPLGDEMGEEGFDPFGRLTCACGTGAGRTGFRRSHCGGVAQFVEANIALVPVDISLFGAIGISAQADSLAEAVGEFFLWHGFCS